MRPLPSVGTQRALAQSSRSPHVRPSAQREQDPPQSTSVSSPSLMPLAHGGSGGGGWADRFFFFFFFFFFFLAVTSGAKGPSPSTPPARPASSPLMAPKVPRRDAEAVSERSHV